MRFYVSQPLIITDPGKLGRGCIDDPWMIRRAGERKGKVDVCEWSCVCVM